MLQKRRGKAEAPAANRHDQIIERPISFSSIPTIPSAQQYLFRESFAKALCACIYGNQILLVGAYYSTKIRNQNLRQDDPMNPSRTSKRRH